MSNSIPPFRPNCYIFYTMFMITAVFLSGRFPPLPERAFRRSARHIQPPSTVMICPVRYSGAFARPQKTSAISAGLPKRPAGISFSSA